MSRSTLPPPGMDLPRAHRHGCGHFDRCSLGSFAGTTMCRKCSADRFNRERAARTIEREEAS